MIRHRQYTAGILWAGLVLAFVAVPASAQDLCRTIVQEAMAQIEQHCDGVAQDTACFGYKGLSVEYIEAAPDQSFDEPGNTIPLPAIDRLQATPLNEDLAEWGVAYARVEMENLETSEDAVVVVIMGDVQLEITQRDTQAPGRNLNFETGGASRCDLAPNRVLLQSPTGDPVDITINEIPIRFGSTVTFGTETHQGESVIYAHTIDGDLTLNPDTPDAVAVQAGFVSFAPLNASQEFAAPVEVQPGEEGFFGLEYYRTESLLPENVMNYPVNLPGFTVTLSDCDATGADYSQLWTVNNPPPDTNIIVFQGSNTTRVEADVNPVSVSNASPGLFAYAETDSDVIDATEIYAVGCPGAAASLPSPSSSSGTTDSNSGGDSGGASDDGDSDNDEGDGEED